MGESLVQRLWDYRATVTPNAPMNTTKRELLLVDVLIALAEDIDLRRDTDFD